MSSPSSDQPSPSPTTPHITVNAGSGEDLIATASSPSKESLHAASSSSRALLPPLRSISGQSMRGSFPSSTASMAYNKNPRHIYSSGNFQHGSSDMLLLPPSTSRPHNGSYRDTPSGFTSRAASTFSSRRNSFESEAEGRISRGPFASPFDDSRATSRAPSLSGSSDDEHVNTQTVTEKYNITPSAGLLLYPEDIEKDDWLHNPDINDPDTIRCDIWNKRGMLNLGGLAFITIGVLLLFVGYPVLTFVRQQLGEGGPSCATDPNCLSDKMPLLLNQRVGLIDPDTPPSAMSKTAHDGTKMNLVFSDEFNKDGRTFFPGDDPYFEAMDIWYGATQDMEWYDPDAVTTQGGTLNLRFDAFQSHNLNYRSGMVQSWNKLCFKGGRMEASIQLPGRGDTEGFWPGFWAMGNLGRPGYLASTDGMWPYSYHDVCDLGITKNQSSPDGLSLLPGMKLPACTCTDQDHPSPGKSRSAPEIDALEASVGFMGPAQYGAATGTASQSLQIAPFDIWYQPDYNFLEIYDRSETSMNGYRGGPYQEALSGVTWLNNEWYEGGGKYQNYGFEYTPGAEGTVTFSVGEQATWKLDARTLRPNGNVGQRVVPEEPMTVIMNFGMSNSFAQVMLANLAQLMPATMKIDFIRIYQNPDDISVTCDPPGYPTTDYIAKHPKAYNNPNYTLWSDTGYAWPKNSLVDKCTAASS